MPNDNFSADTLGGASQSSAIAASGEQRPESALAAAAGADRVPTASQRAPRMPSRSTAVSPWDDEDDDGKW